MHQRNFFFPYTTARLECYQVCVSQPDFVRLGLQPAVRRNSRASGRFRLWATDRKSIRNDHGLPLWSGY